MSFFDSQRREARNRALWRVAYLASISLLLLGIGAVTAFVGHLFEAPASALPMAFWIGVAAGSIVVVVSTLSYPIARQPAALTALALGARPLEADSDGERQRLLNVCAEMAISARIPEPAIFLLEDEIAINALALGRRAEDSVIVVSAGCFLHLDRDALQALAAWCIGRIRDGECRFDSELLSLHHGLLAPYRVCLAPVRWMRDRLHGIPVGYTKIGAPVDARPLALLFGAPFLLGAAVGALGFVFASLLQAAALRRGMFKSDAAVIELTRQREPLRRLLDAVQPNYARSRLRARGLAELGHFSFAPITWKPPLFIESHPSPQRRATQLGSEPVSPLPRVATPRPAQAPRREGAVPTALRGEAPIAQNILFPQGNGQRLRYRDEPAAPEPSLLARCAQPDTAVELLEALFAPWSAVDPGSRPLLRTPPRPAGTPVDTSLHGQVEASGPRQRIALLEAATPSLLTLPLEQRQVLLTRWRNGIQAAEPNLVLWAQWQHLAAASRDALPAPSPCESSRIAECAYEVRQLLSWMLVRSGAAGAPALALLQQHEQALGLAPSPQLSRPDPHAYASAAASLAGLDEPERAALLQALRSLAQHDRRLRDEEWLLLHGLAALWSAPTAAPVAASV
jgi:Zn-dependent protease with chaperone function